MDKFLDAYKQPKLNQDDINHLYRPVTCSEIEGVVKSFLTKNSLGPDGFTAKFYQTFKELIPILQKLLQEIEREGTLPNSFYDASITLIKKPNKDTTKKENYVPISLTNIAAKILNKILANGIHNKSSRSYTMIKLVSLQGWRSGSTYKNL
jgi:hypothetical protein